MVLQYPKLSETAAVVQYADYRKLHFQFMTLYKRLYEDVAVFSLVPEKFILEAEPIIDNFLYLYGDNRNDEGRMALLQITEFMSMFHEFMDEATEMFVEHQSLSVQTFAYLEQLSHIGKANEGKKLSEYEDDFIQLIPTLQSLKDAAKQVRITVDTVTDDLEKLRPKWSGIIRKINPIPHRRAA